MTKGIHPQGNISGGSHDAHSSHLSESNPMYRRGIALNSLAIPSPFSETPDIQTVEHDGEVLFQYFVHEQLQHEGIDADFVEPRMVTQDGRQAAGTSEASTPVGYGHPVASGFGSRLRIIADEFSKSHAAKLVQQEADAVDLNDINQESFSQLLSELFNQGVDKYRLIALFFFCSYVLIRAYNERSGELCRDMFFWALQFVKRHVCRWVYEHGGWKKVLGVVYTVAYKVLTLCTLGVVMIAAVCYIRRNH